MVGRLLIGPAAIGAYIVPLPSLYSIKLIQESRDFLFVLYT